MPAVLPTSSSTLCCACWRTHKEDQEKTISAERQVTVFQGLQFASSVAI